MKRGTTRGSLAGHGQAGEVVAAVEQPERIALLVALTVLLCNFDVGLILRFGYFQENGCSDRCKSSSLVSKRNAALLNGIIM